MGTDFGLPPMRARAAELSGKLKFEVRTVEGEIDALEAALTRAADEAWDAACERVADYADHQPRGGHVARHARALKGKRQ